MSDMKSNQIVFFYNCVIIIFKTKLHSGYAGSRGRRKRVGVGGGYGRGWGSWGEGVGGVEWLCEEVANM